MTPLETIAHYRIVSKLGEGGMGEVWRATDTKLNRDVAIKILPDVFAKDPGRMARFEREAKVLASLNHPNIATIFGVEERALVMELVVGEPPRGPMDFDAAWKIAAQIAGALEYAHERGIVHRDLKPANVMVNQQGLVKLLDFGLAKAFTGDVAQAAGSQENSPTMTLGVTQMGVILGTAAYMSPEQAKGKNVDQRADIWAFGVLLYELLTGERLFEREDVTETLAQVLTREPDLGRVPARAQRLLRRCLEKDPKKRLRDIREAPYYIDEPAAVPAPVMPVRMRWLPWAAVAATAVLAGAAYWRAPAPENPRVHSFILPPERSAFQCGGDEGDPAVLSPDGKRLAFPVETDGKHQLWLRPLDSPAAQALAGTEGASAPFWSHDGRWLGFFADEKLKKVEAAGGTVTVLADAPSNRGGTWNQDDVILFAPTVNSGLVTVPAAGGAAIPVTRRDEKLQEISHRWPSFLPDGKHFLFTSRGKGVFVAALDGKDAPRRLLEESSDAIYSAGYLLYERGNSLLARPFDASRGEFAGPAVTLAQNMASAPASDRGCFTAANGLLAYHSGLAESRLTWIDRNGNRTGTAGPTGAFSGVEMSPEGNRVAAVVTDNSGAKTVWVYNLVRGTKTRVFPETSLFYFNPVWSPDGKRLAIGLPRDGGYAVIARDADGTGGEEVVLRSAFEIGPTAWMANGGLLVTPRDPKTGYDIDYLPPAEKGRDRVRVPVLHDKGDQMEGVVSPSGRWILYTLSDGGGGISEAFVARFPEGGSRLPVSTTSAERVRWGRDGREILFSSHAKLMSATVRETGETLEIGEPRLLFDMRVDCYQMWGACFDVAPDGKRFLAMEPAASTPPLTLIQNWQAGLKK